MKITNPLEPRTNPRGPTRPRPHRLTKAKLLTAVITATTTAAITGATLLGAAPARAASEPERVAIESFRGPQAQRLQSAVEAALMNRYYLVPDFSIEDMARRRGVVLASPDGMAEVGRALQVRAFLSAEVQHQGETRGARGSSWRVNLVVRKGDTGQALGRFVVADRRLGHLESTLASHASRKVHALLARAALAPAAEPEVEATAAAETAPAETDAGQTGPSRTARDLATPISVAVATRVFNRSFTHTQNLSALPDYQLQGAIAAEVQARVHPFALMQAAGAPLAPLGLTLALEYGLGVDSRVAGTETRISTDVHAYAVGLSYRALAGPVAIEPALGYATSTFNAGAAPPAPNAAYRSLTPGVDLRWAAMDRVSLSASARYLHVLSAGALTAADRFPRASAHGAEAALALGFEIAGAVELFASAGLRRFGIATNVVPGDAAIAGGAVDQTTWLGLGLAYRAGHASAR